MAISAENIRKVSWGKSYLWEIRFPIAATPYASPPDPPELFTKWFPAYSMQEPVFNVAQHPVRTAIFDFSIPKSVAYSDLTVSFYDTEWDLLRDWLWSWVMHMFSNDAGGQGGLRTRPLVECVRMVDIEKLNDQHTIVSSRSYWVYPSGQMMTFLNSDSGPMDYTITFTIVGGMFTLNTPGG